MPQGPWPMGHAAGRRRARLYGVSEHALAYLQNGAAYEKREQKQHRFNLERLDFSSIWLVLLAEFLCGAGFWYGPAGGLLSSLHIDYEGAARELVGARTKPYATKNTSWRHFILQDPHKALEAVPCCSLVVQNPLWPWHGENVFFLIKALKGRVWHIYCPRAPYEVIGLADRLSQALQARVPGLRAHIKEHMDPH